MLLDLSELVMRDGMKVNLDVDQPGVEDPDLTFQEPIRGRLTFTHTGDLININGHVDMALTVACSRCLTDVRLPVDLPIEEHFQVEEVLHPDRKPEPDEEFDSIVSSVVYMNQGKPILDLDELLRQLIVSEVPIRTLCDDACQGLCPHCGANRNEAPCECPDQAVNTPLAGLGALLESKNGT